MEKEAPIYSIKNAHLQIGERPLFSGLNLYVQKGQKACLIGRNGSGKSTLLKVIAGFIDADNAEIFSQPGTIVSYMGQEEDFSNYNTLRDVVLSGLNANQADMEYYADVLIHQLGVLPDLDAKIASGGEKKKAALAKALVCQPDILLLDEPTNHLDIITIEKLEEIILNYTGALIVVSHDKAFLNRVSKSIVWLDRGIVRTLNKGFESFDEWQDAVFEQEETERYRLNKKIETETQWLHKGVTARRKRNQGRLHRLFDLRTQRKEQLKSTGSIDLNIDSGSVQSKLILEAKSISKSFGDRTIIDDFSFRLMQGNKIGIVGANGAGKSTLIKLLLKEIPSDTGNIRLSKTLQSVYFDQSRQTLDDKKSVKETLCPDGGDYINVKGELKHIMSYLKDFLFSPAQADTPVAVLSGGEKNRLLLARELAKPSNFLILDEPTNDLDMDTLDLLQDALDSYKGTALIVSHDRDFLDNIATSLLYMAGDGSVVEYIDTCSNMLEKIKQKDKDKKAKENKTVEKKEPVKTKQKPTRLSYKDQRLLELLPTEIEVLESKISKLEEQLNDPDLYAKNPESFSKITLELENLKSDLDSKETKWLELNLFIEEMQQ